MTTPIINPDSLTDEQRERIKRIFRNNVRNYNTTMAGGDAQEAKYYLGKNIVLCDIFGKDFFHTERRIGNGILFSS